MVEGYVPTEGKLSNRYRQVDTTMIQRPRLLMIDDDETLQELLGFRLSTWFLVARASNGREALEIALEFQPDVAILDMRMPLWNGVRTLKEFRARPKLRDLPILVLSEENLKSSVVAAIQAGANDYVIKGEAMYATLPPRLMKLAGRIMPPEAISPAAALRPAAEPVPANFAQQGAEAEIYQNFQDGF